MYQKHQQKTEVKRSLSIQIKHNEKTITDHDIQSPPKCNSFDVNISTMAYRSGCSNED